MNDAPINTTAINATLDDTNSVNEAQAAETPEVISSIDANGLAEAIRAAGCAVTPIERDNQIQLHSAGHGVGFQVVWGNAVEAGVYADFTLSCALRVAGGEIPSAVFQGWHRSKRFARLAAHGELIVLEMDVTLFGGITRGHLESTLRLWVMMVGEFLLYLRSAAAEGEKAPGTAVAG
ncbi:hypothetical protein RN01_07190 [Cupriavidus sp. SHE]|uniref:YbjN domain-containing protein n=1 Tax=Cupriavidus metallidurans TaxID=119219 RepID=A0A482IP50_9BURK|nr:MULTISPECIES: YbjN domain-containing protein [Cupriavidus]KWR84284.1 hypothetical protein RN01_07190 [Cupriavidus sp. SHE]QBP09971.1 YbjN domain-containing protein [Cupriavidus metallidurans]